ncbi:MAG: TRAP transporter small permease subunit [Proteobacteria bacterium]|nr:TRAP transporter small permease subunit [Pseudomonadota bacterium]
MTAVMLLIIFLSSALRVGWVWMNEIIVYLHAALFTLGAAYTLLHDGHVRIDVLYGKMSPRGQAWVNLLGILLLLLPTCCVILWFSFPYVAASWSIGEHSIERQGLPIVFLLKTCILLMPLLLILQGLALLAKNYLLLTNQHPSPPSATQQ